MTSLQGDTNVQRLCCLAGVSRAGYYRSLTGKALREEETELRGHIHEIFLQHRRRYGVRRITRALRLQGIVVNHKRVEALMRSDSLLALRPASFVRTTDSTHNYRVAVNLAPRLEITGPDQLWVADITYIRLAGEFVFLAVVLDAHSRKVVGWSLSRSLTADVALTALQRAIDDRRPPAGLVHHSDRGTQYACGAYSKLLRDHQITPSMSRPANPYDNATCESFMWTLKREEIRASDYADMEQLEAALEEFIERYYNSQRLHSALDYLSPVEFERRASGFGRAATVAYFEPPPPQPERAGAALDVILTRSGRIPRPEPPHLRDHPAPPFSATPTEAPCNAEARGAGLLCQEDHFSDVGK
ncbi:MAG: IS3 family transposase [Armatimonadetes bacterium]|nr:IS3 family transposase [Armatimonadota bacterium]